MRAITNSEINFDKLNGLVPAVIQDISTDKVLMLGFMNEESLRMTLESGEVVFFSRSKNRIWKKGETSGNVLILKDILIDCDNDALLVKVEPLGPTCHTGSDTCWHENNSDSKLKFITELEKVIQNRKLDSSPNSYTSDLFTKGINKIAQKVGEEAVELIIEAMDNNDELFLYEAADLFFHYLVLLQAKGYSLKEVIGILESRKHSK